VFNPTGNSGGSFAGTTLESKAAWAQNTLSRGTSHCEAVTAILPVKLPVDPGWLASAPS
jgi:hypothetical protein